jgi:hypothetical protein
MDVIPSVGHAFPCGDGDIAPTDLAPHGDVSWERIADETLELYETVVERACGDESAGTGARKFGWSGVRSAQNVRNACSAIHGREHRS